MDRVIDFTKPAAFVDELLGLEVARIEEELLQGARKKMPGGNLSSWGHALHQGNQTWVGLEAQTLLTPYTELLRMCELLSPSAGERFVDLGAGYGRLGIILKHYNSLVTFKGFEIVKERVIEGNRILKALECNGEIIHQDLTAEDFFPPEADFYFLYDYGKVSHIRRTLDQLGKIAETNKFKIVARGKGSRSLIDHEYPWLSQVHPVHHEENFSIYSMSF